MGILGRISGNMPFRGQRGSAPAPQASRPGPPPIPGQRKLGADRPAPPPIRGEQKPNPKDPRYTRQTDHIEPRALSSEELMHHTFEAQRWERKSRALSHETGTGHWKRDEPAHGGKYGTKSEYELYGNPVGPRQSEQRHADDKAYEHRDILEGHRRATKRTGPPPIPKQETKAPESDKKGPPPPPPIGKPARKGPPGPPPPIR